MTEWYSCWIIRTKFPLVPGLPRIPVAPFTPRGPLYPVRPIGPGGPCTNMHQKRHTFIPIYYWDMKCGDWDLCYYHVNSQSFVFIEEMIHTHLYRDSASHWSQLLRRFLQIVIYFRVLTANANSKFYSCILVPLWLTLPVHLLGN